MRTISILLSLMISMLVINCETQLYIETGVSWADDDYFSADGDWYLALSEGCYSNCEGASVFVIDQIQITRGEDSIEEFMLNGSSEGNVTAFVYLDVNENGHFDDGVDEITGYKFNYSDVKETTRIAVSAYY